ncbi:hypothetical protein INR49_007962 [Caranx melampygus]|nr:hypothetical protein INR49_007962 [Caranx melampygus]
MCPGPLLLLLLLAALSSENIAYYVPYAPRTRSRSLPCTMAPRSPLHPTHPHLKRRHGRWRVPEFLQGKILELRKHQSSKRSLSITSNKHITVQAISEKHNSLQTALIIPTDKLGTEYLIPPRPTIPGTTDQVTVDVTREARSNSSSWAQARRPW